MVLDRRNVVGDFFLGQHGPLPHIPRVTDHAGGATCQGEYPVPRVLETFQHDEGHKVPRMKRRPGRVEPAVEGDGLLASGT